MTLLMYSSLSIFICFCVGTEKISVGLHPGSQKIWEYEEELGIKFNHILLFQNVKNLNYSKVTYYLDRDYEVILNIEFKENYANLKNIFRGQYDAYLIVLAEHIKNDGRTIWLRTLHEFNGDWYSWGIFYPGNTKEDFILAWKHVVQIFINQNATVKFQLNYNSHNGKDDTTPFSEFWPGDEWIDMVVISSFNRAYTDQWHQFWTTFTEDFEDAYLQTTVLTEKPIGIAETSTTSYGGNKSQWIIETFNDIIYKFPRVNQITWFLENKPIENKVLNWDLNTFEEKEAFIEGMNLLKNNPTLNLSKTHTIISPPNLRLLPETIPFHSILLNSIITPTLIFEIYFTPDKNSVSYLNEILLTDNETKVSLSFPITSPLIPIQQTQIPLNTVVSKNVEHDESNILLFVK